MYSLVRSDRARIVQVGFLSACDTNGAPFVSQADKNPTWTILALALRTSEHITDLMKRGEL